MKNTAGSLPHTFLIRTYHDSYLPHVPMPCVFITVILYVLELPPPPLKTLKNIFNKSSGGLIDIFYVFYYIYFGFVF